MNQNIPNLPPLTGEQIFPDQIDPVRNHKIPNPNDEKENQKDLLVSEFEKVILSFEEYEKISTPPRVPVLGTWFNEGNYGLIHAKRGVGKTWTALHMAQSIAEGKACGPWACHKPRRVLYMDGEMPGASLKSRYSGLRLDESDSSAENIFFLTHETPWPKELGKRIDLKKEPTQRAIL